MAEYFTFKGRLSDSGQIVTVSCPGCGGEIHEHWATDDIRAGKRVLVDAPCAEIIATSTNKTETNRSAWKGSKYYVQI